MITPWWLAFSAPRLRLVSGLVLFVYAATHLVNHALGLVSLDLMEHGRRVFLAFWRFPPVEVALGLSLLVHLVLGLAAPLKRRSLRMSFIDALQLVLGLAIPLWLTVHVLATGFVHRVLDVRDTYAYYYHLAWPTGLQLLTILVVVVWAHGCIGMHRWLRLRPWYASALPGLATAAVTLPVLALLGFISGGRAYEAMKLENPAELASLGAEQRWPDIDTHVAWVLEPEGHILAAYRWVLLGVGGLVLVRWGASRLSRRVRVTYDGDRKVGGAPGQSLLEISRAAGVAHASVCGGRGRCSTCRVRVIEGGAQLDPPGPGEQKVLERIRAGVDVRLACQIRPRHALSVIRLVPPEMQAGVILKPLDPAMGQEAELAILFADLRGFTRLAEGRLPYDTVYLLNRWFRTVGEAVHSSGGRVDKFIGDGVMALFGLDMPATEAARRALIASQRMAEGLDALNAELKGDLREPLRIGIGLHMGMVIVGEMGHGHATSLTAIGDPVNVASRLEGATKELGVQLVVSAHLIERAEVAIEGMAPMEVDVRGREGRIAVHAIRLASGLPMVPLEEPRPGALERWLARVRGRAA